VDDVECVDERLEHLAVARRALEALAAALRPGHEDPAAASALFQACGELGRLVDGLKMLLAADAAKAGEWKASGEKSFAHFAAAQAGTTVAAQQQLLDVSERLGALPRTVEALRGGELSLGEASLIARAATAQPRAARAAVEAELLEAASQGIRVLRERARRRHAEALGNDGEAARYARLRRQRHLRCWTDAVGMRHLHAAGPPDELAPLERRVFDAADSKFKQAWAEGCAEAPEAHRFDALVELGSASSTSTRTARYEVILHVDLAALQRGWVERGERCEIPGVGSVPVAVAKRVIPEALLHLVITNGVDVRTVVTAGRLVPRSLEVALMARDPTCVVPGCNETRNLHIDHYRLEWAKGGPTCLANLCRICPRHHRMRHHDGFVLEGGPGQWRFYKRE
jgi:hypothetical protein